MGLFGAEEGAGEQEERRKGGKEERSGLHRRNLATPTPEAGEKPQPGVPGAPLGPIYMQFTCEKAPQLKVLGAPLDPFDM